MSQSRLLQNGIVGNIIFGYPPTLPEPHVQTVSIFLQGIKEPWRRKSQKRHDRHMRGNKVKLRYQKS